MNRRVVWVDDDTNLLEAEVFDLEILGIEAILFDRPSAALEWMELNGESVLALDAIVVDALLPGKGDRRFQAKDGVPVGLVLCKMLSQGPLWSSIKSKIVLYTRLPDGPRFAEMQSQAAVLELEIFRKSMTSRIAVWLRESGRI